MVWKVKKRHRHALIEQDETNSRKHRGTFFIKARHVKHHSTKEFVEFSYVSAPNFASEKNCRVFAQNSQVAIEVYDYYIKLFNPDYETVSVYDERFDVQYLFKIKPYETWRSVDYYNPSIQVIPLENGVEIKKIFDTDYGTASLEISYIVRTGAFLKHTIIFYNKTADTKTFRVVMKLAGITSNKVKHKGGTETITGEKHIVSPSFFIGEDNKHLKLTEYLWSLGVLNEQTGEWTPTTLKDIVFDVHAKGMKVNIIIGNYMLAQDENLEIDPTTSTYTVSVGSDDCGAIRSISVFDKTEMGINCGDNDDTRYDYEGAFRWTVGIAQASTISSAYLKLDAWALYGTIPTTIISGEDADDPVTFDDWADFDGRSRTSQTVGWTPVAWVADTTYTSPDIKTIIQAIVNRVGFGTHIVLFWTHAIGWGGSQQRISCGAYEHPTYDPPKLEVTWIAPPVEGASSSIVPLMRLMGLIDILKGVPKIIPFMKTGIG